MHNFLWIHRIELAEHVPIDLDASPADPSLRVVDGTSKCPMEQTVEPSNVWFLRPDDGRQKLLASSKLLVTIQAVLFFCLLHLWHLCLVFQGLCLFIHTIFLAAVAAWKYGCKRFTWESDSFESQSTPSHCSGSFPFALPSCMGAPRALDLPGSKRIPRSPVTSFKCGPIHQQEMDTVVSLGWKWVHHWKGKSLLVVGG